MTWIRGEKLRIIPRVVGTRSTVHAYRHETLTSRPPSPRLLLREILWWSASVNSFKFQLCDLTSPGTPESQSLTWIRGEKL